MAAQKGSAVLLKLYNGSSYDTVAGIRATSLSFNAQSVDVTDVESSGQWRELLADAGVKSASISGSGVFKDEDTSTAIRAEFFNQTHKSWELHIPGFGVVSGTFQLRELQYAGAHDGEATFNIALESAGALTFTAS